MAMKILIQLNHPAHYYLFKFVAHNLSLNGHRIIYAVKDKDMLLNILDKENVSYNVISRRKNARSIIYVIMSRIYEFIVDDVTLFILVSREKPDLMIGTSVSITHVGAIMGIRSLMFNEDDYEINRTCCKLSYPYATKVIVPNVCSVGPYIHKKIGYDGIQKMAYLSPKYFIPSLKDIEGYVSLDVPYFVIRLVGLNAIHDIQGRHKGIDYGLLYRIIRLLEKRGKVLISSEIPLRREFDEFRITLPHNKIHSLLAFAQLFIGDSQTMCVESALLGTPYIRFNDFVGKISVLNELESIYELGYGIPTEMPEKLFDKLNELLEIDNLKEIWAVKRQRVFSEKIEVTDWFVSLIESYDNHK